MCFTKMEENKSMWGKGEKKEDQESEQSRTGGREESSLTEKGDPTQQLRAAPTASPNPITQTDWAKKLKLRERKTHCVRKK